MPPLFHSNLRPAAPWLLAILAVTSAFVGAADFPEDPLAWPPVTSTNKPWTRWWWLGSAVDKPNLTRELEGFAKTGLGGVEICPIYGAIGAEDRFLKFLSPEWMAMLGHTTSEAKRLGLGVDMTTGTGWPFGGPQVTPDIASHSLQTRTWIVPGGHAANLKPESGTVVCMRAFAADEDPLDLTAQIQAGTFGWTAPAGHEWQVIALTTTAPIQQVKRSAPGGEGSVLDPFSASAVGRYLQIFDRAFEGFAAPLPRAQFHDSFEYYEAAWTPEFFSRFKSARGYDLRDELPEFDGDGESDTVQRVRADYRGTLGELHLEYLRAWHAWANAHGQITRNQAHGSPGNLLDHYAVSEIPETEIFKHVDENQIPMIRIAASAAHAKGTPLVSAESFTWLDEHFQVTPEKLKEAADFVFLGGVNHIFFHGIPYSPEDVKWPGWLFYASTHMGENGGLWHDLSAFTGYLQRCQSILQQGDISSDVLIYYPIHDLLHADTEKLPLFTVHNQNEWLWPTVFYQTSMDLWNHGVTFDYVTDSLLAKATVEDGKIRLGGRDYTALILPGLKRLAPEEMQRLLDLGSKGARIVVQHGWPTEGPGFFQSQARHDALAEMVEKSGSSDSIVEAKGSVLAALESIGIHRETMADSNLRFVRRSHDEGYHYFIVNRGTATFDGVIPLSVPFKSALILDAWNPEKNHVADHKENGIRIRLAPGQSTIVRTFTDRRIEGEPWQSFPASAREIPITSPWNLRFLEGGPTLPKLMENVQPALWTSFATPEANNFSGTASYSTTFDPGTDLPAGCRLDLGEVFNTARVFLNDKPLGISWCAPHVIDLTEPIRSGRNRLEIQVTNLAANRIADLDRRKVPWKRFHEINFVNQDYKLFDAAGWKTLPSGLAGPVRLLVPR